MTDAPADPKPTVELDLLVLDDADAQALQECMDEHPQLAPAKAAIEAALKTFLNIPGLNMVNISVRIGEEQLSALYDEALQPPHPSRMAH